MSLRSRSVDLRDAVRRYSSSQFAVALTGAGISVACGIPDFRSPGGLWTHYEPNEYGTLEAFLTNPAKAWEFYRALGKTLEDCMPGNAHQALARLEEQGDLQGIVTQNIDRLHQAAGSRRVLEVHGTHETLQCLQCSHVEAAGDRYLDSCELPKCPGCDFVLKPDVVLFGEPIRCWEEIDPLVGRCDLLLVIGTSANVYPIAELPERVRAQGGSVIEFNLTETRISPGCDFVIRGKTETTVPRFVDAVLTST